MANPPIPTFDLPAAAPQTFGQFSALPIEIRHQIWELAVRERGMHFLCLTTIGELDPFDRRYHPLIPGLTQPATAGQADDGSGQYGAEDELGGQGSETQDPDQITIANLIKYERCFADRLLRPAVLSPPYPSPKADISYHVSLNRDMAKLASTCRDARQAFYHLIHRPGGIRMPDTGRCSSSDLSRDLGRVVTLSGSDDTLCLEYLPSPMFETRCGMPPDLDCPDLARIRRVAVRYCNAWEIPDLQNRARNPVPDTTPTILPTPAPAPYSPTLSSSSTNQQTQRAHHCSTCGFPHPTNAHRVPMHLYQLMARYLPNLEQFYFIDYMVHRKPALESAPGSGHKPSLKQYRATGRTYCEAGPDDWHIRSDVMATLDRLRRSFCSYATSSRLSRHADPDSVRFGLLACEWNHDLLAPKAVVRRRTVAPARPRTRLSPGPSLWCRGRGSEDETTALGGPVVPSTLEVTFGRSDNRFEFTFRVPA